MKMTIAFLLLTLLPAASAAAKPKHWHDERAPEHRRDARDDDGRGGACYLQPQDVRIVREYYEPRYRSLPPGLAKKYYRTGRLPPGWERKMEPLPVDVERRLVALPPGYQRGYIDGTIVVYAPRTQVVIDIVPLFR